MKTRNLVLLSFLACVCTAALGIVVGNNWDTDRNGTTNISTQDKNHKQVGNTGRQPLAVVNKPHGLDGPLAIPQKDSVQKPKP